MLKDIEFLLSELKKAERFRNIVKIDELEKKYQFIVDTTTSIINDPKEQLKRMMWLFETEGLYTKSNQCFEIIEYIDKLEMIIKEFELK